MSEQEATLDDFENGNSGSIPSGNWQERKLSEVTQITMGSSPKSEYYNEDGDGLPFFQSNNEFGFRHPKHDRWCSNPRKTALSGDLLMTIRGTYVGQMNLADRKSCIGRGLAGITPGEQVISEFLFQQLNHIEPYVKSIAIGSTFDSISSAEIDSLEIDVPPLPEQRKIATVLYTVDRAIKKSKEITEKNKRIKQGLMQELYGKGKFKHKDYKETRLGDLPSSWSVARLGKHIELISGAHVKSEYVTSDSTQSPYITGPSDFEERGFSVRGYTDEATKFCKEGDILVTVKGSGCGQSTIASQNVGIGRQIKAIRPNDEFDRNFLFYYIKYKENQLKTLAEGSAIPGLNKSHINNLRVPLPKKSEQEEISSILLTIDDVIIQQKTHESQLQRFKRGLMQDLLSGTVRTTDTNIEVPDEIAQHG